jgi:hypothetical protein
MDDETAALFKFLSQGHKLKIRHSQSPPPRVCLLRQGLILSDSHLLNRGTRRVARGGRVALGRDGPGRKEIPCFLR